MGITLVNVLACAVFMVFAVKCSVVHGDPVELCHDSFVAYDAANDIVLGVLFGVHIVCCVMLLWMCRGVSVGLLSHIRRTLADPGARLYEASMWTVTCAMVAYVWWALGSEGVYIMAGVITVSVLCNSATTSYIAPVDLSKRVDPFASSFARADNNNNNGDDDDDQDNLYRDGDGDYHERGVHVGSGSRARDPYSDDEAFLDDYCPPCGNAGTDDALGDALLRRRRVRPRPGRLRKAAMRTLLINIFLHNGVLFLYDITSVLARLDDQDLSDVVRRTLVLANLASVWYRGGQALFYYFKYNFAWRNVMIPQFEAATIVPSDR